MIPIKGRGFINQGSGLMWYLVLWGLSINSSKATPGSLSLTPQSLGFRAYLGFIGFIRVYLGFIRVY